MKKTISTLINLTHTSFLGGYLQFGINYNPDTMSSGSNKFSRFALAFGFLTLEFYANSKSINCLSFILNGTSHKVEAHFDSKAIYHTYRKLERGNWNYKTSYAYSWRNA